MSIKEFLSEPNVQMLWEVLIDEDTILKDRRTQEIFVKTLPEFYEREKSNKQTTLIGLNKQFISIMMNLLRQAPAQVTRTIPTKKISITQEELQNDRTTQFEQEFNKRQQEFTSAMAVPVPTTPVFSDNTKDEPLTELNMIIQRTIAERNLELDKFYKSANKADAENWLKSAPTSIKEEKAIQKANALKTIKIEKNDLNISLPSVELNDTSSASSKQITWGNNTTIELNETPLLQQQQQEQPQQQPDSIFAKLKVMNPPKVAAPLQQSTQTMDIQSLYEYVTKRFDQLEELIRNQAGIM